jgi:hypothetical protein
MKFQENGIPPKHIGPVFSVGKALMTNDSAYPTYILCPTLYHHTIKFFNGKPHT